MRLYYRGSLAEFAQAVRENWYTEWSIGFGCGVLLSVERTTTGPVVILDIPDIEVGAYVRGSPWPGEYLVPAAIVTAHNPAPKANRANGASRGDHASTSDRHAV